MSTSFPLREVAQEVAKVQQKYTKWYYAKKMLLRAKWEAKLKLFLLSKRYPLLNNLWMFDSLGNFLIGSSVFAGLIYYGVFFVARERHIWLDRLPGLITHLVINTNRMTTPFAFAYVATYIYLYLGRGLDNARKSKIRLFRRAPYIELWLLFECMHYMYHRVQTRRLQSLTRPAPISVQRRRHVLKEMCIGIRNPERWLTQFFYDIPIDQIHAENLKHLLACSLFGTFPNQLSQSDNDEVDYLYNEMKESLGLDLKPGFNSHAPHMQHTLDRFQAKSHPLLNYGIVQISDGFSRLYLRNKLGFQRARHYRLSYWYRLADGPLEEERPPIVFVHGIGIGLVMYLNFIENLLASPSSKNRAIFLLELPHISMRMCSNIPSQQETADAVEMMLCRHQRQSGVLPAVYRQEPQPSVFIGHSFGSIVTSWIMKRKPHIVAQAVLLDPVTVCLYLPTVLANFVYKVPETSDEHVRSYFLSHELYIIHALTRHFWWYDNTLYTSDIHDHMEITVLLSGEDMVVPTREIRAWFVDNFSERKRPVQTLYYPEFDHGTFLASLKAQHDIFDTLITKPIPPTDKIWKIDGKYLYDV